MWAWSGPSMQRISWSGEWGRFLKRSVCETKEGAMVRNELTAIDSHGDLPWLGSETSEPGGGAAGARHQSLFTTIDDRMRGRWKPAVMLGLVLSVVLGLLGYNSAEPLYTSTGAIRIVTNTPVVRAATPEGIRTPAEVATQIEYIKGDRVLRHALDDPQLKPLPFAAFRGALGTMKNGLEVKPRGDS